MYVKHTRLTKVAKLTSRFLTEKKQVSDVTHACAQLGSVKTTACPVVAKKRVSRKTLTAHSEDTCEEVG